MSGWMSWLAGEEEEGVSLLLDRVRMAPQTDDKRNALYQLVAVSKERVGEFGEKGISTLVQVLTAYPEDVEIARASLEALLNLMTSSQGVDGTKISENISSFCSVADNLTTLLSILEEKDFYIRYHSIQILNILMTHKQEDLQNAILSSPTGTGRLIDLLSDREIVRNESLLLLLAVVKGHEEIQKIVAFEGAMEKSLDIIHEEGYLEGSIIVQDCLLLLEALLKGNASNQTYFRETSCVQRLVPFFHISAATLNASEPKRSMLIIVIDLIQVMLSTNDAATKEVLGKNMLVPLGHIAVGAVTASDLRVAAFKSMLDIIKDASSSVKAILEQEHISCGPHDAGQPIIMLLVLAAINAKEPSERSMAEQCVKLFLAGNEAAQMTLGSTLAAAGTGVEGEISVGGEIMSSFVHWKENSSKDPLRTWYTCKILSHMINASLTCKEFLLKVPLEIPTNDAPPEFLVTKVMQIFVSMTRQKGDFRVRVGALLLLCTWLSDCPSAVACFLDAAANLPFLVDVVVDDAEEAVIKALCALLMGICLEGAEDSAAAEGELAGSAAVNRWVVLQVIATKIKLDTFTDMLDEFRKHEMFLLAEKGRGSLSNQDAQTMWQSLGVELLDKEFTLFFKTTYDTIRKRIVNLYASPAQNRVNPDLVDDGVIQSYKDLIRSQDKELESLRKRAADMDHHLEMAEYEPSVAGTPSQNDVSSQNTQHAAVVGELQELIKVKDNEISALHSEVWGLKQEVSKMAAQSAETAEAKEAEILNLANVIRGLEEELSQRDTEIDKLRRDIQASTLNVGYSGAAVDKTIQDIKDENHQLHEQLKAITSEKAAQAEKARVLHEECLEEISNLSNQTQQLHATIREKERQLTDGQVDQIQEMDRLRSRCSQLEEQLSSTSSATENKTMRQSEDHKMEISRIQEKHQEELESLQRENETAVNNLNIQLNCEKERRAHVEGENARLAAGGSSEAPLHVVSQLEEQVMGLNAQVKQLSSQLSSAENEKERLRVLRDKSEGEVDRLTREMREQTEKAAAEEASHTSSLEKAQAAVSQSQLAKQKVETENEQLRDNRRSLEGRVSELTTQVGEQEKALAEFKDVKTTKELLETKVRSLSENLIKEKEERLDEIQEKTDEFEQVCSDLRSQNESLKTQLNSLQRDLNNSSLGAGERESALRREVSELRASTQRMEAEIMQLRTVNQTYMDQVDHFSKSLQAKEVETVELKESAISLSADLAASKAENDTMGNELKSLRQQVLESSTTLAQAQELSDRQREESEKELRRLKEDMEKTVNTVDVELETTLEKLKAAQADVEKVESRHQSALERLQQQEKARIELEGQLREAHDKLQVSQQAGVDLQKQIDSLMSSQSEEGQEWKKEAQGLADKLKHLQEEHEDLLLCLAEQAEEMSLLKESDSSSDASSSDSSSDSESSSDESDESEDNANKAPPTGKGRSSLPPPEYSRSNSVLPV